MSSFDVQSRAGALQYTRHIVHDLLRGVVPTVSSDIIASFPVPAPDAQFWARGPFEVMDFRAPGDGRYVRNDGFFFATGAGGLAATVVGMAARSAGNRSRRRAAEAAAQPRWITIGTGDLYLAPSSFTMAPGNDVWTWPYGSVKSAEMVSPGQMRFTGLAGGDRPINWILKSDWAELAFVSWAVRHHPQHPQMQNSRWLDDPATAGPAGSATWASPPAEGWYPDPGGVSSKRYFDGWLWTDKTRG